MLKTNLINNTLILNSYTFLSALLSFLSIPILINLIGITEYGLFLFYQLFTFSGICPLLCFGFPLVIRRMVAENILNNNVNNSFLVINLITIIFFSGGLVLVVLYYFFNMEIYSLIKIPDSYRLEFKYIFDITIAMLPFQMLFIILRSYFEGAQRFLFLILIDLLRLILFFVFAIILAILEYSFAEIIYLSIILFGLSFLCIIYYYFKDMFSYLKFKNFLTLNYPFLFKKYSLIKHSSIQSFLSAFINNIERIFIIFFLNPEIMSLYEIVIKIPKFIKQFFSISNVGLVPAFASINIKKKLPKLAISFSFLTELNFLLAISVSLPFVIFSESVLSFWMGEKYIFLTNYLSVALICHLILPLSVVSGQLSWSKSINLPIINLISFLILVTKITIFKFGIDYELWTIILAELANFLSVTILILVTKFLNVSLRSIFLLIFKIVLISSSSFFIFKSVQVHDSYLGLFLMPICFIYIFLIYYFFSNNFFRQNINYIFKYILNKYLKGMIFVKR